jgi:hypothetical protein
LPSPDGGSGGGTLVLDAVVLELREDAAEEAAAPLADERLRGAKKFALLAAPWLAASAWAVRFFAAFAAVAAALSLLPVVLPLPMLKLS